jgi:ABC-type Mn2+/Zn2+ transport system permease subunit
VLLLLIGAAIVVAAQGLGNLLVVALLVGPAATARMVTRRAAPMMAVATAVAVLAGIVGLYASYHASIAAGASIAAALVVAYALTALALTIPQFRGSAIPRA